MATALTLDVLTANIKNDRGGDGDERKLILEDFFQKCQPDAVLIQENPWTEDNIIKKHVKAIGENYNTKYARRESPKTPVKSHRSGERQEKKNETAVLYRKTSLAKLDCIEVSAPPHIWQLESPPRDGFPTDFADRATVALFEAKGKLAQGPNRSRLFMISWHGKKNAEPGEKISTFQQLLRLVNDLHYDYDSGSLPIPVVLGGDFNLKSEDTRAEIQRAGLQLVDCRDLSSFRRSSIDYFIVTKDIQVDKAAYVIPYEKDPNGNFNHAPVMARLTFPKIKFETADDVDELATNLKTTMQLSPATRASNSR